jgi:putative ABC transport system permease protein
MPFRLVVRNLARHPFRSLLTVLSLAVAVFLLCVLRTLVVTLDAGVKQAASDRVVVQSSVSLFVYLPESYESKIRQVPGVEQVVRWNWFGGHYRRPENFFAQFAVDADRLLDVFPEMQLVAGSREAFETQRTACLVGVETARKYGFRVGETIPIIGALYPRTDGEPWGFQLAGTYHSTRPTLDDNTLFFHADYLRESLDAGSAEGPHGVGIFFVRMAEGTDRVGLMRAIDELFENGPQRVQTTTEAEFQAQFVSMVGNVPVFVSSIGTGVLLSILLAVLNTMLMAAREQTHDVGVLKALGFTDGTLFGVLLAESLLLSVTGGGLGIAAAVLSEASLARFLSTFFPNYDLTGATLALAAGLVLFIGLAAGIAPAWRARRLRVVDALRATA